MKASVVENDQNEQILLVLLVAGALSLAFMGHSGCHAAWEVPSGNGMKTIIIENGQKEKFLLRLVGPGFTQSCLDGMQRPPCCQGIESGYLVPSCQLQVPRVTSPACLDPELSALLWD